MLVTILVPALHGAHPASAQAAGVTMSDSHILVENAAWLVAQVTAEPGAKIDIETEALLPGGNDGNAPQHMVLLLLDENLTVNPRLYAGVSTIPFAAANARAHDISWSTQEFEQTDEPRRFRAGADLNPSSSAQVIHIAVLTSAQNVRIEATLIDTSKARWSAATAGTELTFLQLHETDEGLAHVETTFARATTIVKEEIVTTKRAVGLFQADQGLSAAGVGQSVWGGPEGVGGSGELDITDWCWHSHPFSGKPGSYSFEVTYAAAVGIVDPAWIMLAEVDPL